MERPGIDAQTNYKTEVKTSRGGHKWMANGVLRLDPSTNWRNPGFTQANNHPDTVVTWNDAVALCKC